MSQNTGTLVTAPIRPNNSNDRIASAFSNEVRGGHHTYETLNERNSIILERRQWGMLVTVYNDGINNGTYILELNREDNDILNNDNWAIFSGSGGSFGSNEWASSVISVVSDDGTISPMSGDRYLVSDNGLSGNFVGRTNSIATFLVTSWGFQDPVINQTLRVLDEPNSFLKYDGTKWVRELLNQVRYISPSTSNNIDYTYITDIQSGIIDYDNSVYISNFGATNSGTCSLSIDLLPNIPIKKLVGNELVNLVSGDIVPDINYVLTYNSSENCFQANIPATTGIIGDAEDGTYEDGLFTDFTVNTPIGVAVDRFNEVLKALAPPPAPNLNSWSSTRVGVTSKLSFAGDTTQPFTFSSATQSPYGAVNVDGTFSVSAFRLGTFTASGFIGGTINSGVLIHPSTPTAAYGANSFGQANLGTLSLFLNGNTISTVGLTTLTSIDTTIAGATSGLNLSAATSSKFPSGLPFDAFMNRTGTWRVYLNNPNVLMGYNWVDLRHEISPTLFTVSRYEFVMDTSTYSISFSSPSINVTTVGTVYLSGIQYYTQMILDYSVNINNLYAFTYNTATNGLSYLDTSNVFVASPAQRLIPPTNNAGNANPILAFSQSFVSLSNRTLINGGITLELTARKTFLTGVTTAGLTNIYLNTLNPSDSTNLVENFVSENFRLPNSTRIGSYNTIASVLAATWDSTESLLNINNRGLIVANRVLSYPNSINHSSAGSLITNPNFGNISTSYDNIPTINTNWASGSDKLRVFTRRFRLANGLSPTYTSATIRIVSNTMTVVPLTTALSTASRIWLEIKLPGQSGAITGWMDCGTNFNNFTNDGSGCVFGTVTTSVSGLNLTTNIPVTFGNVGTSGSDNYLLLRVTMNETSSVQISQIQIIV